MTLSILKYKHSLLLCGGLLSLITNINAEAISSDNIACFQLSISTEKTTVTPVAKPLANMKDDKPASVPAPDSASASASQQQPAPEASSTAV